MTLQRAPTAVATGVEVRGLMRGHAVATLATQLAGSGWPYASLVLVATAADATPLLLVSRLAEHTKNIAGDHRVSLLFDGTESSPSRLAGARATVLGRAMRTPDEAERGRFLRRHPDAEGYAGFADFGLFRVQVERAHLVAGFGRIHWVDERDILLPADVAAAFAKAEPGILATLNGDAAVAKVLGQRLGAGEWTITGADCEGVDTRAGGRTGRVAFAASVRTPADIPAALHALATKTS
ncbi:MAG: heme iron utilization protein [Alphaproteobacteria bacterium]|nr:heme iron utilization protein [Alphaproteobacteria bacterium]